MNRPTGVIDPSGRMGEEVWVTFQLKGGFGSASYRVTGRAAGALASKATAAGLGGFVSYGGMTLQVQSLNGQTLAGPGTPSASDGPIAATDSSFGFKVPDPSTESYVETDGKGGLRPRVDPNIATAEERAGKTTHENLHAGECMADAQCRSDASTRRAGLALVLPLNQTNLGEVRAYEAERAAYRSMSGNEQILDALIRSTNQQIGKYLEREATRINQNTIWMRPFQIVPPDVPEPPVP
jgi:hypothetical protein